MNDEVILAAILLAAAGLLLVLTIIMFCVIFQFANSKSKTKGSTSEIPKSGHHHDNSAFQRENSSGFHGNQPTNDDTRVSYYGNQRNDDHKAEWPTSYNMYAVSRSYAFPKAVDHSEQGSELGSKAQPSNPPSTIASRSSIIVTHEGPNKTFSEEVFEGINYATATTLPKSEAGQESDTRVWRKSRTTSETASLQSHDAARVWKSRAPSDTASLQSHDAARVWKSRAPSDTASLQSHDAGSVHGSTVSHEYRVTEKRSYYSSFKPRNTSVSSETTSQVVEVSRNSGISREKITTHSIKSSGTTKVFTFDIK